MDRQARAQRLYERLMARCRERPGHALMHARTIFGLQRAKRPASHDQWYRDKTRHDQMMWG
jgi:hypothetical protein